MLMKVFSLFEKKLHKQPVQPYMSWKKELKNFLINEKKALWHFRHLYPYDYTHYQYCLTHGDPTLGNTMLKENMEIRLIDPLPPKGMVPSLPEIDYGKVLQSVLGWESVVVGKSPNVRHMERLEYFKYSLHCNGSSMNHAWFWCGIHLLRILPYAEKLKRNDARDWCRLMAGECFNAICI
jgi:hypothetical protein